MEWFLFLFVWGICWWAAWWLFEDEWLDEWGEVTTTDRRFFIGLACMGPLSLVVALSVHGSHKRRQRPKTVIRTRPKSNA